MNFSKHLNSAIKASLEAGKKILEIYHSDQFEAEIKKDSSPLTKADLEKWYVENQSITVDFKILVLTVWAIVYTRTKLVYSLFKNLPKHQL